MTGPADESAVLRRRERALADVLRAVTSGADLQTVLLDIASAATALFDAPSAAVFVLEGAEIGTYGHFTRPDGHVARGRFPRPNVRTSSLVEVLREREVIRFDDQSLLGDEYEQSREAAHEIGIRSSVYVPVPIGGAAVGVAVFRVIVDPFTDDDVTLLQAFAAQAANAVEGARRAEELATRNAELDEALARQQAMTDVLDAVSTARTDLSHVFAAVAAHADRLCGGTGAGVLVRDGDDLQFLAGAGRDDVRRDELTGMRFPIGMGTPSAEAAHTGRIVHIADWSDVPPDRYPDSPAVRDSGRSVLAVPMLRNGDAVGVLAFSRDTGPYTDSQVALLQTFANQAAIAVDNASLLREIEARNHAIGEALDRQTAMTEVLDAVSTARVDLQPVYDSIARHASRICGGHSAQILLRDGDALIESLPIGVMAESAALLNTPGRRRVIDNRSPAGHACLTGRLVHVRDWSALPPEEFPDAIGRLHESRASLVVPMMRNGEAVGVLGFLGDYVATLTDSQVALLQTFANQAAIAVDNARLLSEIETRNEDLSESLQLQTAMSEVLRLISANPGNLFEVFQGIVRQAAELCDAPAGSAQRYVGDELEFIAHNLEGAQRLVGTRVPATLVNRTGPTFIDDIHEHRTTTTPARSMLSVPLLNNDELFGQLTVTRFEVRPFAERHGRILQSFAEQAAIAISNARLFNDLDAALTRQTANAEILRVISTSPGDLGRTLPEISRAAERLADARHLAISYGDDEHLTIWDDERGFRTVHGEARRAFSNRITDQARAEGRPLQLIGNVADWHANNPTVAAMAEADGVVQGTVLFVPMRGNVGKQGFIMARRDVPVPFSDDEVALLEEFTAQAVIALDNAELLARLEDRNNDLAESLELQTATAEVLTLISTHPGDLRVVLDGIVTRAASLCGATEGSVMLVDGDVLRFDGLMSGMEESAIGREVPIASAGVNLKARDQRSPVFVDDFMALTAKLDDPIGRSFDEFEVRSFVTVALFHHDTWIGNINLNRRTVDPFDPKVGPILQAFADQAVLAIQNAGLFRDLEQKNEEVAAALEQQTAVGAVLQTISRSAFDLGAVLDELTEQANRIVGASQTGIVLVDSGEAHMYPPDFRDDDGLGDAEYNGFTDPAILDFHVQRRRAYYTTVPTATAADEMGVDAIRRNFEVFGPFSNAVIPLLQGERVVGLLAIIRQGVHRFTDSEKRLLQTFADQAVIAVENARLFRELEERNRDVSEALEQQTAIAEVLEIISSSPTDLEPVLNQVLSIAARLCDADLGLVWQERGDRFRVGASHGLSPTQVAEADEIVFPLGSPNVVQQVADGDVRRVDRDASEFASIAAADPDPNHRPSHEFLRRFRAQAYLMVPLSRPDSLAGVFSLMRWDRRPFTDRDEALVHTFADQAVIAIENSRLFSELQAKTEELEIASRHKSEFLANMSHELRTPLNAIIGYAELIAEECADLGNDQFLPDLAKIQSAGKHLLTLISGILDLAKVEAGRMDLFVERIDLAAMVTEVDQIVRPLVEKNHNEFVLDCPIEVGWFDADLVKVKQVLFNLLSNAAKFTEGGSISLAVHRRGADGPGVIDFIVTDTGIGMTDEQMGRLFEAFSQADVSTTRKYGGTGLGLALSRSFCQMMGGDIIVASEPGVGSTFTVTLPITPAHVETTT